MEEDVWKVLEMNAREQRRSISDLVRQAVREKYLASPSHKRDVMMSVVGLWKDRDDLGDTEAYVRKLRKGERISRLHG
jgi:hypothetical protein